MTHKNVTDAFDRLHPKVQRWIWKQKWFDLRDIQKETIPQLLDDEKDIIIAATTASGKTEAAFLPIVSKLLESNIKPGDGFGVMYVSPLRALINDQFQRLESLCEELNIPVFKWHGDVSASLKSQARKRPEGIILITPESLEAILMRQGLESARLFKSLSHIVVDELHAFMNVPRGKQLQSLLSRLEQMVGRSILRVGLSATLPDMYSAAFFLRPFNADNVAILQSKAEEQEIKLQLRAYIEPVKVLNLKEIKEQEDKANEVCGALGAVCEHLFKTLRQSRNLIFAGSRQRVEEISARLTDMCIQCHVPGEFLAHHGSLARAYREEAEKRMKDNRLPVSIVCTTTLELGIDIGNIESVAQIGSGHTVSGMRQRLGRSGRREDKAAVLRVYIMEQEFFADIHPIDSLRLDTVQAIAMIELMLQHWNEPLNTKKLHLSTLMHQILALICQYGGLTADNIWNYLIKKNIFQNINKPLFVKVLKRMGHPDVKLLEQVADGALLLGAEGERITSTFDFYAVFETPEECRVVCQGHEIGRLPMTLAYQKDSLLILGGKYWRIIDIDLVHHEIIVDKGRGGRPPAFSGQESPQADAVVAKMKNIYLDINVPIYLDATAIDLLHQARQSFVSHKLFERSIISHGNGFLLFPWLGSAKLMTLLLVLVAHKLKANINSIAIEVHDCDKQQLRQVLEKIVHEPVIDVEKLAMLMPEKAIDKFDHYLDSELQAMNFASAMLDSSTIQDKVCELLKDLCSSTGAH